MNHTTFNAHLRVLLHRWPFAPDEAEAAQLYHDRLWALAHTLEANAFGVVVQGLLDDREQFGRPNPRRIADLAGRRRRIDPGAERKHRILEIAHDVPVHPEPTDAELDEAYGTRHRNGLDCPHCSHGEAFLLCAGGQAHDPGEAPRTNFWQCLGCDREFRTPNTARGFASSRPAGVRTIFAGKTDAAYRKRHRERHAEKATVAQSREPGQEG